MLFLKTKRLDPGYTGTGKSELETLGYSYNIHNEITGINKDYALKTPGKYDKWGNFFGLYLGFDNRDNVFNSSLLNGQVTGTLWTTQGDDLQRKYDFTYDNAGRLTSALFNERQTTGESWSNAKMDFSVTGNSGKIGYDLNGNLLSMLQKGIVPGSNAPVTVDDLQYVYNQLSNKLRRVTDNGNLATANGRLGDFTDGSTGNNGDYDYEYDDNGNLVVDLNKKATNLEGGQGPNGIRYNFLDKPEEVHINGKGTIKMVYDADGNKLQKIFSPDGGGAAVTTTYANQFIYQGDNLQYIHFEEGRIRVMEAVSENNGYDMRVMNGNMDLPGAKRGAYDFFVRDYQGNVRMILTEETHLGSNACTMETARAANEEPLFGQVDQNGNPTADNEVRARFAAGGIPGQEGGNGWQNSAIGSYVSCIGNLTGKKVGPNTLLKVMAGDQVSATTIYYYQNPIVNQSGGPTVLSNLLVSLTQAILGGGVTSGLMKDAAPNITSRLNSSVPFSSLTDPDQGNALGNTPKAYLSIMFFDERFNFVTEGSATLRVEESDNVASALVLANIKAPKNGYAYVYVSNVSDEMVYFDNLQVTNNRGHIVEENHYYAYGLKIAGISSRKLGDANEGHLENRHLYNDKELIDDADLNWYDYGFRSYDAQIGRFPQLDPLTDSYPFLTPYQYGSNDPITNIDLDGLEGVNGVKLMNEVVVVGHKTASAGAKAFSIGGALKSGLSLASNAGKAVANSLTKENLLKAADVITDFVPLVSGGKDIYNGIVEGNGWKVAMGVGFIALDVATLGGSSLAKGTVKTAVKIGVEVVVQHEAKQLAILTARKVGQVAFKAAKGGLQYSDDLLRAAQKAYPKLAGKTHLHHITPKFLGGPADGPLIKLDAAYHQQITNAFRAQWGYGLEKPTAAQLETIMNKVYSQFPLPQ